MWPETVYDDVEAEHAADRPSRREHQAKLRVEFLEQASHEDLAAHFEQHGRWRR